MIQNIINYILSYAAENGLAMLYKWLLAFGVFIIIQFIIKRIIAKIKTKIQANAIQTDAVYMKKLADLVGSMIFIALMIFNILIVFGIIWFDVAILMGGISLWLGFAMETTIGNMVAGILIMTNKKVKLGDLVMFMWSINTLWKIEEINIRYCVVSTIDKRRLIIPNMLLAKTPVQTLKSEALIRGSIQLKLARHVDVQQVKNIINGVINNHEKVLFKNYTTTGIAGFDSAGIIFNAYFFINPSGGKWRFVVGTDIRKELIKEFKKYGIKAPYEHITITTE